MEAAEKKSLEKPEFSEYDYSNFYYGAGDEAWKYHQQNDLLKLRGSPRQRPLRASLTLLAPPASDDKEVLQALAEPDVLDALGGLDEATLAPLFTALAEGVRS